MHSMAKARWCDENFAAIFSGRCRAEDFRNGLKIQINFSLYTRPQLFPHITQNYVNVDLSTVDTDAQKVFLNASLPGDYGQYLEVFGRTSDWTTCNKCGDREGETRRSIECYIRVSIFRF
jgi:hypothetical protein